MTEKLKSELLELKRRLDNVLELNSVSEINNIMELSSDIDIPYEFECEALHPGVYHNVEIEEEEIKKAVNTIFNNNPPFRNDEINIQHLSAYKDSSTPRDLVGQVTSARYDDDKKAYIIRGKVFDREIATRIANGLTKYVSLGIRPHRMKFSGIRKKAKDLEFKELSFVRVPEDNKAQVIK